jgi:hypothetical protein
MTNIFKNKSLIEGTLYCIGGLVSAFVAGASPLISKDLKSISWLEWGLLFSGILLGGINAIKAFRNTTFSEPPDSKQAIPLLAR